MRIVEVGDAYATYPPIILIVANRKELIGVLEEEANVYSDAVRICHLEIDTAPYIVKPGTRAFGLKIHYSASSRVNPFNSTTINLYELAGENIRDILNEFEVFNQYGENNGRDNGYIHGNRSIFVATEAITQGYFDLMIKTKNIKIEYSDNDRQESNSSYELRGRLRYDRLIGQYKFHSFEKNDEHK